MMHRRRPTSWCSIEQARLCTLDWAANRILKAPFEKLWADREKFRGQWPLLALAAASLLLAYVFGKMGSEVLEGEMAGLDQTLRAWMQRHHSPGGDAFFGVVTHLGAKEVLAPISALLGWRL